MKNNKDNLDYKNKQEGFSLIEVMITVAILGIISSIAYPSYMKQVQKSKRTPAKVELMRIAQLQESFYVQNLTYAKTLSGNTAAGGLGFASGDVLSEGEDYKVILEPLKADGTVDAACTGTSVTPCIAYRLSATPVSGKPQAHDNTCTGLRLTNTGAKSAKSTSHTSYGTASVRDECW
ncbi:MAG: type IV pilin protein [Cocleimonas sp.]|nr:type IV pilin protein [Cocleimonas sp.]